MIARLLLLSLLCACTRAAPWPAWPEDVQAARALIAEQTLREPGPTPTLTADAVAEQVRLRVQAGEARVGWPAIVALLQERVDADRSRPFYLLWGNYHDAPAQVAALGRVLGPLGVDAPWLLAAEPFAATGRWRGVPADCQRGDEAVLADYRATGGREALRAIVEQQGEHNVTARRYGLLDVTAELLVALRANGVPVLGCDVPKCLGERLWDVTDAESMRTRELHCVLALRRTLGSSHPPERVAMLWGQAHVRADGVARYLPADADVLAVRLLGGRHSDTSIDHDVARLHGLTEPVLLPLADEWLLLLPDARSFAPRVRKRDPAVTPPELAGQLYAFSQTAGELVVPGGRTRLDLDTRRVPVRPGHVPFVFLAPGEPALVGAVDLAENGWVEIEIDARDRLIATVEHAPNPEVGHTERL